MKRLHPDQPPYLSACMIVRDSEKKQPGLLEQALRSVRERAPDAEIVIVDTQSSDAATIEISQRYADVWESYHGPAGDWSPSMAWFSDAAAARQRSFELAHGVWRMWLDDDDLLVSAAEAERILKLNGRWQPPLQGRQAIAVPASDGGALPTWEDVLRFLDAHHPQIEWLSAAYAYEFQSSIADGIVTTWQERERIVKWGDGSRFHWVEPAHESLVYCDGRRWTPHVPLAAFLWVHQKKHTDEDRLYSLRRHYDVLIKEYVTGRRTTRNCLYLANYARFMCPERQGEFLNQAVQASVTDLDALRAHVAWGNFYAERGLLQEARASFGAAVRFRPDLPDAWAAGANAAVAFDDHAWAVEWWEKAIAAECSPDSLVNPREHLLRFRIALAMSCAELARRMVTGTGVPQDQGGATRLFQLAAAASAEVAKNPSIGSDVGEAAAFAHARQNDYDSQVHALQLHALWAFLVRNDETQKAARLLECVPHTLEDHPAVIEMERWARPITKHLTDPAAYRAFYADLATTTDALPSEEEWLSPARCLPRAMMVIEWVKRERPQASVLEVGSFDGICGIPILRACPGIRYTAVDANEVALDRFQSRAVQFDVAQRLRVIVGTDLDADGVAVPGQEAVYPEWSRPVSGCPHYDAVCFFEVLEHVPDPRAAVERLLSMVAEDGLLFLSTPWGAFDHGHPGEMQSGHARDPRGHVRAMTVRDAILVVEAAGGEVVESKIIHGVIEAGETLHVVARRARG